MREADTDGMRDRPLEHKGHTWNWSQYHKWSERSGQLYPFRHPELGIVGKDSTFFCMGSCFADHVAEYLRHTLGIPASSFGESRFYDTTSVLQTARHLLDGPQYDWSEMWVTDEGKFAHPFRNPRYRADTLDELKAWSDRIEDEARAALRAADFVVITLGGTETWRDPVTKKAFVTMPFPDVFDTLLAAGGAEFYDVSYAENYANLEQIYLTIREHAPQAQLIYTVSPIRMTFTVSGKDVAVVTSQSKSVLRAAAGELADRYRDDGLHYFHSYEVIQYAPPGHTFFNPDDIHVSALGVRTVMHEFARCYIRPEARGGEYALEEAALRHTGTVAGVEQLAPYDVRAQVVRALRTVGLEAPARWVYSRYVLSR